MAFNDFSQFPEFVNDIKQNFSDSNITLEEYLINIWYEALKHKDKEVTTKLIFSILETGFNQQNNQFDEEWLSYTNSAEVPYDEEDIAMPNDSSERFNYFKQTILFQIAELHKMKANGTLDRPDYILYGGVTTPSGYSWYNFTPLDYLRAVASYLVEDGEMESSTSDKADWLDLESILDIGRMYE